MKSFRMLKYHSMIKDAESNFAIRDKQVEADLETMPKLRVLATIISYNRADMLPQCCDSCDFVSYFHREAPEACFDSTPAAEDIGALFKVNADGKSVTAVLYDKNANILMSWLQNQSNLSAVIRSTLPNRSYSISASSISRGLTLRGSETDTLRVLPLIIFLSFYAVLFHI